MFSLAGTQILTAPSAFAQPVQGEARTLDNTRRELSLKDSSDRYEIGRQQAFGSPQEAKGST